MIPMQQTASKKQARLGLRLNEEHKERIERAAAAMGQTVNSFASSELLRRSEEILEREEFRYLSDTARDRFLALLDSDTAPNAALKEAAREYKKGQLVGGEYQFDL